ncbi:glycosyltransferase family 4 protein [Paraflavisolibacter sp. H34]|uniref:glycosyltransferase family 4 protein n=1 Tax=Huijunlia imazamoxiresistens TaxID=3127457 RepID=UPI003019E3DB
MRIAFVTYECPPETGGGGIGTYVRQVSRMLYRSGHSVTVFAGSGKKEAFWEDESIFRIPATNWTEFNNVLPGYFNSLHRSEPFDVVECMDFCGCGLSIKKMLPTLPIVVRLHTPLYMVDRLLFQPLSLRGKVRFIAGALLRWKLPSLPLFPQPHNYRDEFAIIELAERVCSPSRSIYNEMLSLGYPLQDKTDFIPLPFAIPDALRSIIPRKAIREDPQIMFIGRMEKRKGVIDLARSIPLILKRYPKAHFTFVGSPSQSPVPGVHMMDFLKKELYRYTGSVSFTGGVPPEQVPGYLSQGDIFVFPSHYESFGLVCCEAMAAGKAVVASRSGGMSEIIEEGTSGLLVPPHQPQMLAAAVLKLIGNERLRLEMGTRARERIHEYLDGDRVVQRQVGCYQKAIELAIKKKQLTL